MAQSPIPSHRKHVQTNPAQHGMTKGDKIAGQVASALTQAKVTFTQTYNVANNCHDFTAVGPAPAKAFVVDSKGYLAEVSGGNPVAGTQTSPDDWESFVRDTFGLDHLGFLD